MRLLATLLSFAAFGAFNLLAQPLELSGKIDATGRYVSPTGLFRVKIPVLPELGGEIVDTPEVVTFRDSFTVHETIACFHMDATNRWEHSTRGARDYLIWFYNNVLQSDFNEKFPGSKVESARFLATTQDGALIVAAILPGGSMFADRSQLFAYSEPAVAKRGNLLFVRDEHVYVLSVELAERVTQASTYNLTVEEEDQLLRTRLLKLLESVSFTSPPKSAP